MNANKNRTVKNITYIVQCNLNNGSWMPYSINYCINKPLFEASAIDELLKPGLVSFSTIGFDNIGKAIKNDKNTAQRAELSYCFKS